MSLVPASQWTVLLRDESRVVLHHPQDQLITVKRILKPVQDERTCPTCHRPFPSNASERSESTDSNFVSRNYFRILSGSHLGNTFSADEDDPSLQGYYDRFFVEERKLGRGQRGSVFLVQHILNGIPLGRFAVKAIPVGKSQPWLLRMLREVRLLERLHHPNIIEYKHAWMEDRKLSMFGPRVPCLFILMELANQGNLEEYLHVQWDPYFDPELEKTKVRQRRKRKLSVDMQATLSDRTGARGPDPDNARRFGGIGIGPSGGKVRYLTEYEIWKFFLDICSGLAHLHKHGIIHRDLKPPNLLLHKSDNPDSDLPRILLSDFGECELISDEQQRERTGSTGTLEFMPPELLKKDAQGNYVQDHSLKADIWSLGVVLYFLCYSDVPYSQTEDVDLLKEEILSLGQVHFPPNDERVSQTLRNLIQRLMDVDALKRPSAEEILQEYRQFPIHKRPEKDSFWTNLTSLLIL